jgi:hypothetical protein
LVAGFPKLTSEIAAPAVAEAPSWTPVPLPADDGRSAWAKGLEQAARPIAAPVGVTTARETPLVEADVEFHPPIRREGRFGPVFGTVVHRVLALKVAGAVGTTQDLVGRVAREEGLESRHAEAASDVEAAWRTLTPLQGAKAAEFPVAALEADGRLLQGYIDLLVLDGDDAHVIDFKTDPPGDYPAYADQVRAYVKLLKTSSAFTGKRFRASILFTATGSMVSIPTQ